VPQLPHDRPEAFQFLLSLYEKGNDAVIRQLAPQCEQVFGADPEIMNIVYMTEVNGAMNGLEFDPGRVAAAVDLWNSAKTKAKKPRAGISYNIGNALGALGRQRAAIAEYRLALASDPTFAQCWKNMGTAYLQMGKVDSAQRCFEKALEHAPQLPEALYSLATLHFERGDVETALTCTNRIGITHVSRIMAAGALAWKARFLRTLGRHTEGLAAAEDAIHLYPQAVWTWASAAPLYIILRHEASSWLSSSMIFWERFTRRFPEIAEAWIEYGHVAWLLGRGKSGAKWRHLAVKCYRKGLMLGCVDDSVAKKRVSNEGRVMD
jgi:tetratricopeptide (TPR) repeat protein